jgi:hypothetical protein
MVPSPQRWQNGRDPLKLFLEIRGPGMRGFGLLLIIAAVGCGGGPGAIAVPDYRGAAIAARAMELLDANRDGALDDAELAASPGLKAAKAAFDADRDGKLTAAELAARFDKYAAAGPGLQTIQLRVTQQGRPLDGAVVTLTPEPFLTGLAPSTGTSDANGDVSLQIDGLPAPGLYPGVYRVTVRKDGLPAKYHDKTELGCEVPPAAFSRGAVRVAFELTPR